MFTFQLLVASLFCIALAIFATWLVKAAQPYYVRVKHSGISIN
jgi:hypothetical protein